MKQVAIKTEIKKILFRFLQDGLNADDAAQQIFDLFESTSDNELLALLKSKENAAWISIDEKLPEVRDDFETMLETQKISKPVIIKLAGDAKNKKTGTNEIDGYFVNRNGKDMWSLDKCGTGLYYPLQIASHWRYSK